MKDLDDFEAFAPEFFEKIWRDFKERFLAPAYSEIPEADVSLATLNFPLLAEAIGNAKTDIQRLKTYHLPYSHPDRFKYAGNLGYWISKLRPVELRCTQGFTPILNFANDYFAIWTIRSVLEYDIPNEYVYPLVYMLHFRQADANALTFLAQVLEEVSKLKSQLDLANSTNEKDIGSTQQ